MVRYISRYGLYHKIAEIQALLTHNKIDDISMPFDPGFARQTLLPLAVHAYTEAGLPEDCESLDIKVFNIVGKIEVDPARCMQVWSRLESEARQAARPTDAARASSMLSAVMADSHTFGYIATHQNGGNTETFVCFRGTHFLSEWLDDADLPLIDFQFRSNAGLAHMGFQAVYETVQQSILDLLKKNQTQSLTILGHSLGAALATICALDMSVSASAGHPPAHVFPIASPRVGDEAFRNTFDAVLPDCVRIVNKPDIVPHLPLPIDYRHVGVAAVIDSGFRLDLVFAHGLCEGYVG
jgi:triacylglycerol lipase